MEIVEKSKLDTLAWQPSCRDLLHVVLLVIIPQLLSNLPLFLNYLGLPYLIHLFVTGTPEFMAPELYEEEYNELQRTS